MSVAILNPARVTIPMQGRHLRWLNDGRAFLAHLGDLAQIHVAAVCVRCLSAHASVIGGDGPPRKALFSCTCHAGEVRMDQELDITPLLSSLGWALVCTTCGEPVEGGNDPLGTRFTVECPCTTREYRVALA